MKTLWMIPFFMLNALFLNAGEPQADLEELVQWLTGSFSSAEQAAEDETYYDIRLEMVPIWKDRTDGHWLYVEQAVATHLDQPYRQRIYQVVAGPDGSFKSIVYSLPEPLQYAGAWKHENPLADLDPDKITIRKGCTVTLFKKADGRFEGSTTEKECESNLRGASYATSEITVKADAILSWDRGFDAQDQHVWGAEKAGYLFKRIQH